METEINLTPDFKRMFAQMLAEAERQAQAEDLFDCLPHDLRAEALRSVQRFLAPLNIAAQCMTNAKAVGEFREALSRIAVDVDKTAGDLEAEKAEDEEEN